MNIKTKIMARLTLKQIRLLNNIEFSYDFKSQYSVTVNGATCGWVTKNTADAYNKYRNSTTEK